jgi:hypothetical protein
MAKLIQRYQDPSLQNEDGEGAFDFHVKAPNGIIQGGAGTLRTARRECGD